MTPVEIFAKGGVVPAHPLALTAERRLDERHQLALGRYYVAAGAVGMAVGVHTTQFSIHDNGMLEPVLGIAMVAARESGREMAMIAGVQGSLHQAVKEAQVAARLGYNMVLLRPEAGSEEEMIERARAVGEVLPVIGFYLQPAVGGRVLSRDFWTRFAAIEAVVGIKIAPFDRYKTLDVIHGVACSGRHEKIALYTGNDDNILVDLVSRYEVKGSQGPLSLRFVGGLLGQFAVWTKTAVDLFDQAQRASNGDDALLWRVLRSGTQLTEANAAIFDAANNFHGCVAGINEVLARQGLLAGRWCLDANEDLSPGQADEITRVSSDFAHLTDYHFISKNLERWLR